MAQHDGSRVLPVPEHDVQIGVADAGRGDGHLHLAGSRLVELHLGDPDRLAGSAENRRPDLAARAARRRLLVWPHAYQSSVEGRNWPLV